MRAVREFLEQLTRTPDRVDAVGVADLPGSAAASRVSCLPTGSPPTTVTSRPICATRCWTHLPPPTHPCAPPPQRAVHCPNPASPTSPPSVTRRTRSPTPTLPGSPPRDTEDQIFEITAAAAVGAALRSFDAGRNALGLEA
ncbi:hypothetical protein [Rhodococcus wratislaviensis]|uniref:hypothetical protein n=1 Tax=Rhodococcus wratislaviensis TaxID=44752 RepID=UPI001CEC0CAF|nr:hypothetical protein [Rhodococcus wratislaviensis]